MRWNGSPKICAKTKLVITLNAPVYQVLKALYSFRFKMK